MTFSDAEIKCEITWVFQIIALFSFTSEESSCTNLPGKGSGCRLITHPV